MAADLAPDGKSVGAITTVDYHNAWCGLTDPEYRRKKNRVGDVLLRRLNEVLPGASDAVVHQELATPHTIERFTHNPLGTAYGFAPTPNQTLGAREIEPSVDGLHFASAWSSPGGGFTGAILSGAKTARSLTSDVGTFS
ncbi:phytoene desaturase family protein [Halovenus salina]|uniref:Phytoene desaturase family protein n=1 Tax=Halovenus salina TaxID=1510225 RepID=A0ABD5WB45_9EURY|nr:FAD-dependent oxidoreductase [Halovenus salina]